MSHPLRTLALRFPAIPLLPRDIPRFRAGVCESAGMDNDLFHNHADRNRREPVHNRPALVQYRVVRGRACVWGMGEGAIALERWWLSAPDALRFGGRTYPLHAAEVRRENTTLAMTEPGAWKYYRLHDYLPLNTDNYQRWLDNPSLVFRACLLESVLTGHLLGFCQAAGWWLTERLQTEVVDLHSRRKTRYHDNDLMKFELTYRCNLLLPDNIALGKAVSHGFGVQWPVPRFEAEAPSQTAPAFRHLPETMAENTSNGLALATHPL